MIFFKFFGMYKRILFNAVLNINKRYFNDNRTEREFQNELYHQARLFINDSQIIEVTTETTKSELPGDLWPNFIRRHPHILNFINSILNRNNQDRGNVFNLDSNRFPDLLFHKYRNRTNQELIVEVKKFDKGLTDLKKDLLKLILYCNGRLDYKKGVLLLYLSSEIKTDFNLQKRDEICECCQYINQRMNRPISIWIAYPTENGTINIQTFNENIDELTGADAIQRLG